MSTAITEGYEGKCYSHGWNFRKRHYLDTLEVEGDLCAEKREPINLAKTGLQERRMEALLGLQRVLKIWHGQYSKQSRGFVGT